MATFNTTTGKFQTADTANSSNRENLDDLTAVIDSPIARIYSNLAQQTTAGAFSLATTETSFLDFSNAEYIAKNSANNQNIVPYLDGDVLIGADANDTTSPFQIHLGENDITDTHIQDAARDLFAHNAKIVCNSEIIIYSHLNQATSDLLNEPSARNALILENNNSASKIKVKVIGRAYTADNSYVLNANVKARGSFRFYWALGSNITSKEIDYSDGIVDFLFEQNFSPPTKATYRSKGFIKLTGEHAGTTSSPTILGSKNTAFSLDLPNGQYYLSAFLNINNNHSSKLVYLNFAGVDWGTRMAVFRNMRQTRLENHKVFTYKTIDNSGNAVSGVKIILTKRYPTYNAQDANAASVSFPSGNENTITSTSNSTGDGELGSTNGSNATGICVEAFSGLGGPFSGNVDTHYATASHFAGAYANYDTLKYSVFIFGKVIQFNNTFTAGIAGSDDEGVQSIGNIVLQDDANLTATTSADVPTSATTFDDIYDMLYKYAIDNDANYIASVSSGVMAINASTFTLSSLASTLLVTSSLIIVPCASTVTAGTKITALVSTGTISTLNANITGAYRDSAGVRYTLTLPASTTLKGTYGTTNTAIPLETVTGTTKTLTLPTNQAVKLYLKPAGKTERYITFNSGAYGGSQTPAFLDLLSTVNTYSWISQFGASFSDSGTDADDELTINITSATNIPNLSTTHTAAIVDRVQKLDAYANLCLSRAATGFITVNAGGSMVTKDVGITFSLANTISSIVNVRFPIYTDDNAISTPQNTHTNRAFVNIYFINDSPTVDYALIQTQVNEAANIVSIKAKTDSVNVNSDGEVESNLKKVNGADVTNISDFKSENIDKINGVDINQILLPNASTQFADATNLTASLVSGQIELVFANGNTSGSVDINYPTALALNSLSYIDAALAISDNITNLKLTYTLTLERQDVTDMTVTASETFSNTATEITLKSSSLDTKLDAKLKKLAIAFEVPTGQNLNSIIIEIKKLQIETGTAHTNNDRLNEIGTGLSTDINKAGLLAPRAATNYES